MKLNSLYQVIGIAGVVAGFALTQGCSTIHSDYGREAEDMRLRPMPEALEPEQVTVEVYTPPTAPARPQYEPSTSTPATLVEPQVLTTDYTVQRGDTLSGIAYRYNLRWQDIAAVNPGMNPNRIVAGETIRLPGKVDVERPARRISPAAAKPGPAASGGTYTVKPGDSLSVIAYRHGIKTDALRKANNLTGDKILVGQKLVIPKGGTKKPAPQAQMVPRDNERKPVPAPDAAARRTEPTAPAAPEPTPEVAEPNLLEPVPPAPAAPAAPAALEEGDATAENAEDDYQTHTVQEGEDLYAVAIRWGVSPTEIKNLNNLTGSQLKAGAVLKIPPAVAP